MSGPSGTHPGDRVRILLLRGDNLLKSSRAEHLDRALATFAEASEVAQDPSIEEPVRQLVERRLAEVRRLLDQRA